MTQSEVVNRVSRVQEARRNLDDGLADDLKAKLYVDVLRAIAAGTMKPTLVGTISHPMTLASLALEAELETVR